MNDSELDTWLRNTHPQPVLPASFQREVWARIAQAESSPSFSWKRFSGEMFTWISRPVPAMLVVASMVGLGAGFGVVSARNGMFEHRHAYLASIDPLHPENLPRPE